MPAGRRWQDLGLSVSFRACDLRGLEPVGEALRTAASPDEAVLSPIDVSHLDLAENELEDVDGLVAFDSLVSLDLAHNNVSVMPSGLGSSLLHLNLGYNRLEHVGAVSSLISLVELNLGYNLLTSLAPLEPLVQLQVLLLAGNRVEALDGLAPLCHLELLDLRHNYISRLEEVRLLALNPALRTLALGGNPVARREAFRASVVAMLPTLLVLDGQKTPRSSSTRHASVSCGNTGRGAGPSGNTTRGAGASASACGNTARGAPAAHGVRDSRVWVHVPNYSSGVSSNSRAGIALPSHEYRGGGEAVGRSTLNSVLARSSGTSYGSLQDPSSFYERGGSTTSPGPTLSLVHQSGMPSCSAHSPPGDRPHRGGSFDARTPTRKPPLDTQLRRSPTAASMVFGRSGVAAAAGGLDRIQPVGSPNRAVSAGLGGMGGGSPFGSPGGFWDGGRGDTGGGLGVPGGPGRDAGGGGRNTGGGRGSPLGGVANAASRGTRGGGSPQELVQMLERTINSKQLPVPPPLDTRNDGWVGPPQGLVQMIERAIATKQQLLGLLLETALNGSADHPTAPLDTPLCPQRLVYSSAVAEPTPAARQTPLSAALPSAPTLSAAQPSAHTLSAGQLCAPARFTPPATAAQPPQCEYTLALPVCRALGSDQPSHSMMSISAHQRGGRSPPTLPAAPSSSNRVDASRGGTGGRVCAGAPGTAGKPARLDAQLRSRPGAFEPREGPATLLNSLVQLSREAISRRH